MADLEAALKLLESKRQPYCKTWCNDMEEILRAYHGEPEPDKEGKIEAGATVMNEHGLSAAVLCICGSICLCPRAYNHHSQALRLRKEK